MREEILSRLEDEGVNTDQLADAAFELYEGEEIDEKSRRNEFKQLLKKYLGDENIQYLVLAGVKLNETCDNERDEAQIIADELLGLDIAGYIAGKKGQFNFTRYDRRKPGVLGDLGFFLDDVVGGLIAGCMTRLFEDD